MKMTVHFFYAGRFVLLLIVFVNLMITFGLAQEEEEEEVNVSKTLVVVYKCRITR